jgi:MoxR-like ATPase
MQNIETITTKEYIDLIDFSIEYKKNLLVFGPPGVGKTDIPEQRAKIKGINHFNINFSVLDAPDIIGVPLINEQTKQTEYCPPEFLPKTGHNLMVGDELDKLKPEIQSPLLSLFRYKMINNIKYAIDTIIATANEPEDNSFSLPISAALTNRCMVYRLQPDIKTWLKWAADSNIHPLVSLFIEKHPEQWLIRPKSEDLFNYAYPTPRSWVDVSNNLNDLEASQRKNKKKFEDCDQRVIDLMVSGSVGMKAKNELRIWLNYYRDVDPFVDKVMEYGSLDGVNLTEDKHIILCLRAMHQIKFSENTKHIDNVFNFLKDVRGDYGFMAYKVSFSSNKNDDNLKRLSEYNSFRDFTKSILSKMNKNID